VFSKILIANRGEIACRVIATARRLGIRTVAVYSVADAGAKHVAMADEAFLIGPAPVADSYLRGDVIIGCALKSGAEAIHPGYGFLAENPGFVRAVEKAGLVFIGPPADAIEAMGLKDAAKERMQQAGVPIVPGYHGDNQDPAFLDGQADRIGYPVLIKARAGGGGRGMRRVEDPADFRTSLESAQREAEASFGDPVCLIERYIPRPRHIEMQVFGDTHGNVIHLFERDCSLQRRHQKVIEEAPAPGMTAGVRDAMGRAAIEAARAIGYSGAGTVEFIADGSGPLRSDGFWFMEMNTRLQVEHPVSEAITGLDFVELQLRVAAGEPLPVSQDTVSINGWSFEARVYAEDVRRGFLPATGTVTHLSSPDGAEFEKGALRIDSGIRQGDVISSHYDPMIAKVIVHGPTRTAALNMLTRALGRHRVGGTLTNLAFLSALSAHEGFASGEVDTDLIARDTDLLTRAGQPDEVVISLAALASLGLIGAAERKGADPVPEHSPRFGWHFGWRHWSPAYHKTTVAFADEQFDRTVWIEGHNRFSVVADDGVQVIETVYVRGDVMVTSGGHRMPFHLNRQGSSIDIWQDGACFSFRVPDPTQGDTGDTHAAHLITAPMPGTVTTIDAADGVGVSAGERLLVLEAMKMEHALSAPRDAVIRKVLVMAGEQVQEGAVLIKLEPDDE